VTVVATLDDGGRRIRGCLRAPDAPTTWRWVDPLATPLPTHDLDIARTFPGRPMSGTVRWSQASPDCDGLSFETELPRRWGVHGATGAWTVADGGWFPQPLEGGALAVAAWDVSITLPADHTGLLGDQLGTGTLRWRGLSDVVSFAAIRDGELASVDVDGTDVRILTAHGLRRGLQRNLPVVLGLTDDRAPPAVPFVEVPMRRRLAVAGGQAVYLSDRAYRVFPWFHRLHHHAVGEAAAAVATHLPDGDDRALAGATTTLDLDARVRQAAQAKLLRLTRWLPIVDAALYDREMPFLDDVFRARHPTDRVAETLDERWEPGGAARPLVDGLAERFGPARVEALGAAMIEGRTRAEALLGAGLPADALAALEQAPVAQNYRLDVQGSTITVSRDAPFDAPPDAPVVLGIDGHRVQLAPLAPGGHATWTSPVAPRSVVLDPDGLLRQTSRLGDQKPARWRWTLSGQITGINLTRGWLDAVAFARLQRADVTRHRLGVLVATDLRAPISGRVSYTFGGGPLVRGTTHPHQWTFAVGGAYLNRTYSDLGDARGTLGASVGWAWDTRVTELTPMRGHRLAVEVRAGGAPDTAQRYVGMRASALGLVPFHPRLVLAGRLAGGAVQTDIVQERLRFGGELGVRAVPDVAVQTEVGAVGQLELRATPVRQVRLPLGVLDLEAIDLIAGVDAGVGWVQGQRVAAVGGAFGVSATVHWLGLSPGMVRVTVGVPAWVNGFAMPDRALPFELYLGWGHPF
jgi:hypothetical protein